MRIDLATAYVTIPAHDVFNNDRVACTADGAPIHTRLRLNEALAHGAVTWKGVEDHFGPQPAGPYSPAVEDGFALIVWHDETDVTVPADATLFVHQS
jgi:hypothetical protein